MTQQHADVSPSISSCSSQDELTRSSDSIGSRCYSGENHQKHLEKRSGKRNVHGKLQAETEEDETQSREETSGLWTTRHCE